MILSLIVWITGSYMPILQVFTAFGLVKFTKLRQWCNYQKQGLKGKVILFDGMNISSSDNKQTIISTPWIFAIA